MLCRQRRNLSRVVGRRSRGKLSIGCRGIEMEEKDAAIRQTQRFRVGGPYEVLALLWG